ncbi:MAG: hypothetical protein ACR2JC_11600 [Chloroflexota bacterium]
MGNDYGSVRAADAGDRPHNLIKKIVGELDRAGIAPAHQRAATNHGIGNLITSP